MDALIDLSNYVLIMFSFRTKYPPMMKNDKRLASRNFLPCKEKESRRYHTVV